MIRAFAVLGFSLAVASTSLAQGPASPEAIEEKYNRIEDITRLDQDLGRIHGDDDEHTELKLMAGFKGEGRSTPLVAPRLLFMGRSPSWEYLHHHPIALLVDGQRWSQDPKHDGRIEEGYVLEFLYFRPSPEQWQALSRAKSVEGRIGTNEFKLNAAQLEALHEFARLVEDPKLVVSPKTVSKPASPKAKSEVRAKAYTPPSQPRSAEVYGDLFRELEAGHVEVVKKADAQAKAGVEGAMDQGLDRDTVAYFQSMAAKVGRPVEEIMDVHAEGRARGWWVAPEKRANFARSNPESQIQKQLQIHRDTNVELLKRYGSSAAKAGTKPDLKTERQRLLEKQAAKRKERRGR